MIYVFDSNTLIDLFRHYYPERFPSLWENFNHLIEQERLVSTREVYKEISNYDDALSGWAKSYKESLFLPPTPDEMAFVREIFEIRHFQMMIRKQERLKGKPVADPFVIAKARIENATVVTQEHRKENAAKIPNVCDHFQISCMNLEEFMQKENWVF